MDRRSACLEARPRASWWGVGGACLEARPRATWWGVGGACRAARPGDEPQVVEGGVFSSMGYAEIEVEAFSEWHVALVRAGAAAALLGAGAGAMARLQCPISD